ncbi:MAG TPA: amidohydrolase/deacetylase family metallohydrolase, partial [Acidimicrobiia bacterium]|nr:amidohydrolase/deacetylase family metallohydrolase [Acidimicrobiia bacterium]
MDTSSNAALLLRGGRVVDPAGNRDEIADVLVESGRISAVGRDLTVPAGATWIDARGLIVTPGLVDLHVHVYPGLGDFCLPPDQVGVDAAVTTVIDAGTSGAATFGLARRWIDDPGVRTRVLALMDPCQIYFATKD